MSIFKSLTNHNSRSFLIRWGLWRTLYAYCLVKLGCYFGFRLQIIKSRELKDSGKHLFEINGYVFRKIESNELFTACNNSKLNLSREFVENSLRRGDECFGALRQGELVGFTWRTTQPTQVSGRVWVKFSDRSSYHYKSFVLPECRGKNLLGNIILLSEKSLIDVGKSACISYVESHNYASLKASKKSGNRTVGYAAYINNRSGFYSLHSAGAREFGFCFYLNEDGTKE